MSSQSTTQIPGDAPGRAKFFYHSKHDGARRVDLKDKDIAEGEIRRLMAEGWTEKRTAVMLYHEKLAKDGKVFRSDAEIAAALKIGWQMEPVNHPHAQDTDRLIHLSLKDAENADDDAAKESVWEAEKAEVKAAKDAEKAERLAAKEAEKAAKKAAKEAA